MSARLLRNAMACAWIPAALALTGCATLADSSSRQAQGPTESDVYVHRINEAADRQGMTKVIWLNPPRGGESARIRYSLEATVGDEESGDDD
jgi:hypothetical protein